MLCDDESDCLELVSLSEKWNEQSIQISLTRDMKCYMHTLSHTTTLKFLSARFLDCYRLEY